jgi:hypothetical protein
MSSKTPDIGLLKNNFKKVEEKYIEFFKQGTPRWPQEQHDLLRNHHMNIDNFSLKSITLAKLKVADLPENILQEVGLAYEAFIKGEEYK